MNETNSLVMIERPTALSIFTSKENVDNLIDKIEKMARAEIQSDVGTAKTRKDIASLAYKVAQTKAYIDAVGKDLVTEMKELPKKIDETRREIRDRLDGLRDEVRAPLDAWEAEQARVEREKAEAEAAAKARTERISADIAAFMAAPTVVFGKSASAIEAQLNGFSGMRPMPEAFGDRLDEATQVWLTAIESLRVMLEQRRQIEAFEQEQRERVVAAQAEERARKAAEQQVIDARLAQERAERAKNEAEERAKRAAEQHATDARLAQERAERANAEAEARARQAAEEAAARERAKIEAAQRQAAEEAERRARNVAHRKAVNRAALKDLMELCALSEDQGKAVIIAAAAGNISHVQVIY